MKYIFAGDRLVSCHILEFLISEGHFPLALLVSSEKKQTHAKELIEISTLNKSHVFHGNEFKQPRVLEIIKSLEVDYIIGIHFPYIIPGEVLEMPKIGVLNLHPAYLPFNKGWHTPSWAIMNKEPYGATLHFMSPELDEGDIIHQKLLEITPEETADSLYQRVLRLEEECFYESFDQLISLKPLRIKQGEKGSSHIRKDLEEVQKIDLNQSYTGKDLIDKLRALSTSNIDEAAYFEHDDEKYAIQIIIKKLKK